MAGIYIHIPFCKQACYYCNFHFSTSLKLRDEMLRSINVEIELQKNYINEPIETIYFGGGTPSIISVNEIDKILQSVYSAFSVIEKPEITLEANPDDLNGKKLRELHDIGINRLSIGVQSFNSEILTFLHRIHDGNTAVKCIDNARKYGFKNISADLIYNIVEDRHTSIKKDMEMLTQLQPEHISAYNLTIEPKTVFGNWKNKGRINEVNEEYAAEQFDLVINFLEEHGYQQYEISNFARDSHYSTHNTNYWRQKNYLGVGPAAHSFDGESRQFNVANNSIYIKSISSGVIPCEKEMLDHKTLANETIMTGLRTIWGCNLQELKNKYGYDIQSGNQNYLDRLLKNEFANIDNGILTLTGRGKKYADEITAHLMWV